MKIFNRIILLLAAVFFTVGSVSDSQAYTFNQGIHYSPDGGGGGVDDPPPEPITLTEEEWKKKKGREIFNGGFNEAKTKFERADKERLQKLKTAGITADDYDTALDELLENLSKKGANKAEEIKLFEERITGLNGKLSEKDKEITAAKEQTNNYIINAELANAAATLKAIDPSDAITVFRSIYRVERLVDGSIHIYDKSGSVVQNSDFLPASLSDVMAQMLEKKPHLIRHEDRGGSGGERKEGVPPAGFMNRDPQTWTEAEKDQALKDYRAGKFNLADTMRK